MADENAKTEDMNALKQVKRMLRSKKHMEEISYEIGWSIGMEGRWRFYVPDRLDKLDTKLMLNKLNYINSVRLDEIYDNPELYRA